MANWTNITIGQAYDTLVLWLNERFTSLAKGNDPAKVTNTNILTDTICWSSQNVKWQRWNGSAWVDLAATYAINISGNAGSASVVPWSGVTGKPTTVAGYGITNAITASNIGAQSVNYATSAGSATTATSSSNVPWSGVSGKPFNWAGQGGQPSYVWGSNDGVNYYVWNPSNFSVNYANSSNYSNSTGNADTLDGYHASSFAMAGSYAPTTAFVSGTSLLVDYWKTIRLTRANGTYQDIRLYYEPPQQAGD